MEEIGKDRIIPLQNQSGGVSIDPSRIVPMDAVQQQAHGERMEYFGWRDALGQAFRNAPKSALKTGRELVTPILHPIQTAKGLGKMAAGAAQKLIPGEQKYEENIDALVNLYKERYGGLENFKQTMAEDPVGMAMDVASLLTGGGAVVKGVGTAGKISSLSSIGSKVSKAGAIMEPYNLAKGALAAPFKLLPESVPVKMYQSAAKFATTLPLKERYAITKTALNIENQIMPTVEGLEKLRRKINSLNDEISQKISPANLGFYKFDITGLRKGLLDLKDEMLRNTDEPLIVRKTFSNVSKQLDEVERLGQMRTPWEVQKIKQNIYKELESFYEKQKASPVKVVVRKRIASNARQMLEDIIPEIKSLNQKDGALIELWDSLETKAARISNRDLIGIGLPIKIASGAAGGYAIGGELGAKIGTGVAIAHGILDSPIVKAKLAIVLNRMKEQGITIKPTQAAIRLGMIQAGRTIDLKPHATLVPNGRQ